LSENVIVRDGNFRVFGGLPKPGFKGYKNWSSSMFETESKRGMFLEAIE
jgi:hypothetical protein